MIFSQLNNRNIPQLDPEIANNMLQNVFQACGQKPNVTPLHLFESNAKYHLAQFSLKKMAQVAIIVTTCATPGVLITPDFTVTEITQSAYAPIYEINVDSWLPIDHVSATLNGKAVSLNTPDTHLFTVEPDTNGDLCITVSLINGRSASRTVQVTGADSTAPTVSVEQLTADYILVHVADTGSGLDYDTIHGTDAAGNYILPGSIDRETGMVMFPYTRSELTIHIRDLIGNQVQLSVKPTSTSE